MEPVATPPLRMLGCNEGTTEGVRHTFVALRLSSDTARRLARVC
jgi:hypothetical protein